MAQTFTVSGTATCPLEDGSAVAPMTLAASLVFTSRSNFVRTYASTVTDDSVNFGTLVTAGAKGLLIKCTAGNCTFKFNAGDTTAWPLAIGGYFLWINTAQGFPKEVLLSTTGAATVVFLAVG